MTASVAFLGAGNMAAAMIDGLIAAGTAPDRLACYSASGRSAAPLAARTGIQLAGSLAALTAEADTVVIAFKPQHLAAADPSLAELTRGRLVISVLAGKRLAQLLAGNVALRQQDQSQRQPVGPGSAGRAGQRRLLQTAQQSVLKALERAIPALGEPHSFMPGPPTLPQCGRTRTKGAGAGWQRRQSGHGQVAGQYGTQRQRHGSTPGKQ